MAGALETKSQIYGLVTDCCCVEIIAGREMSGT